MADQSLNPATYRRLGRPLPHQLPNRPRPHLLAQKLSRNYHAIKSEYPVLAQVSLSYPDLEGRLVTCYSPVRHFITKPKFGLIVRLACVKHAASVHPEPGSNSPFKKQVITYLYEVFDYLVKVKVSRAFLIRVDILDGIISSLISLK